MKKYTVMESFIDKVKSVMSDCGVSQAELARRLSISRQAVFHMLSGEDGITFDRAERVADALGFELEFDMKQAISKKSRVPA